MSNDLKYWMWRFAAAACVVIEMGLLIQMIGEGTRTHGHIKPWAVAFFIVATMSLALGMKYTIAKSKRWNSSFPPESDIETLNAYYKQQEAEKNKKPRSTNSPQ